MLSLMVAVPLQAYVGQIQTPIRRMSPYDELCHALMLFLVQAFRHNCTATSRPCRHFHIPYNRTFRAQTKRGQRHRAPIALRSYAVLAPMSHPDEASCSTGPCTPQHCCGAFHIKACALFKSRIEGSALCNRQQESFQDMASRYCCYQLVALEQSQYLSPRQIVPEPLVLDTFFSVRMLSLPRCRSCFTHTLKSNACIFTIWQ